MPPATAYSRQEEVGERGDDRGGGAHLLRKFSGRIFQQTASPLKFAFASIHFVTLIASQNLFLEYSLFDQYPICVACPEVFIGTHDTFHHDDIPDHGPIVAGHDHIMCVIRGRA